MAFSLARVAQVAGAMGEADADPAVEPPVATDTDATPSKRDPVTGQRAFDALKPGDRHRQR